MGDPDAAAPDEEPSLSALFEEIRKTVEMEAQIIAAVFPTPALVMQTFLQRIFAQSVQQHIEVLMQRAELSPQMGKDVPNESFSQPKKSHIDLAFLRTLQLARDKTIALVNDLKAYDARAGSSAIESGQTPSYSGADGAKPSSNALQSGAAGSPLSLMLDNAVEELFVPFMEGSLYIDRERRSLQGLYSALLARFIEIHVSRGITQSSLRTDRIISNRSRGLER